MLHRPQITSNHDPAKVTMFHSTHEHTLDHFLEFWIFEGVRHFLGLLNQPPTPLITLARPPSFLPEFSTTKNTILAAGSSITERERGIVNEMPKSGAFNFACRMMMALRSEPCPFSHLQGPKKLFARCDKHYPSRSGQTSLGTAVANFTKPRTSHFFDLCTKLRDH